jgi:hypothetical protein
VAEALAGELLIEADQSWEDNYVTFRPGGNAEDQLMGVLTLHLENS